MTDLSALCPGCFAPRPSGATRCPECGLDESGHPQPPFALPYRTVLRGEYAVGKVLGKPGGFGLTYLAWHRTLEQKVAIKEYFLLDPAERSFSGTTRRHSAGQDEAFEYVRRKFVEEAKTLARLVHPNIVRVRDGFVESGKAYLVMDYVEGKSFAAHLAEQGGRLPEAEAVALLLPVLDALGYMHEKGTLHRDIKPENLYITEEGRPLLLDFGAAREALVDSQSRSVVFTPGYAPLEQYDSKGTQGAWTDVYAAAATLYHLVTGEAPPTATLRAEDDTLVPPDRLVPGLSPGFCRAVLEGLALRSKDRPQSAAEFRALLLLNMETPPAARPAQRPPTPPSKKAAAAGKPLIQKKVHPGGFGVWRWAGVAAVLAGSAFAVAQWREQSVPPPILEPTCRSGEERTEQGIVFVRICGGTFTMGSAADAKEADADEKQAHPVTLSEFWIGKTEVTNEQYRSFRASHEGDAQLPATMVTWNDAKAACEHFGGRLPTEAEWEYAARAGSQTVWSFGDDEKRLGDYAWYNGNSGGNAHPVGQKKGNAWGLHDVHGNVWEWVADWYDPYPGEARTDPKVPETGEGRVRRGGSIFNGPGGLRPANRGRDQPENADRGIGFRCVLRAPRQP